TSFPHDPDAWCGVGHVEKRAHPRDYRAAAQAEALAHISREISVRVRTENSSAETEDALGREESFSRKTRSESRAELTGYRLAGVYETPEDFWVCYTLDKEEYRRALAERRRLEAEALAA